MNYEFDEYAPASLDSDIFLSEIPVLLLKENVINQFDEPLENRNDYISIFIDKYRYSKDQCDDDNISELNSVRDDFMQFMLNIFKDYLGIGIVDFDELSEDKQDDYILMLYRFFIINIKKNFVHLILNYTDKYKKSLAELSSRKKDVTTLSFKKEIKNPDDINIIANLKDIIDFILNIDMDVQRFLDLTYNSLETEWLDEAYSSIYITGNFVDRYRDMLNDEFKQEIESKVRNKILKKYKNN